MPAYWFIRTQTTNDAAVPVQAYGSQALFNRDVSYAFSALAGNTGFAGDLLYRASANAVPGHILCDGSAIGRINYPDLFAAIGTSWGAGNGTTTFNIPTQAGLSAQVITPPPTPPQTVDGGSVGSGTTPTSPTGPSETGGIVGGEVDSGGRFSPQLDQVP